MSWQNLVLCHTLNIKGGVIKVIDLDQTLTNVTIKESPIQIQMK